MAVEHKYTDSLLKFLQQDMLSLRQYYSNEGNVKIEDVKHRLFLQQRLRNTDIPDHYYKLANKNIFDSFDSFYTLFTRTLPTFADCFLQNNNARIYVKESKFVRWQNLIPNMSPLLLISSYLYGHFQQHLDFTLVGIRKFFSTYIIPNARYTALVAPDIKLLKFCFTETHGMNDLHVHLNGVIESDAVWQNLLTETDKNITNFIKKTGTQQLQQAVEQNDFFYSPSLFSDLLERAKLIREKLLCSFLSYIYKREKSDCNSLPKTNFQHPFVIFFADEPDPNIPNELLRFESLMYILIFKYLQRTCDENTARLFHEYLLIQGFFSSMVTQNMEEKGFEQFQMKTKNKIYGLCDEKQVSKFLQLSGNDGGIFKFAEFRFVPLESTDKMKKELIKLDRQWADYINKINPCEESSVEKIKNGYALIAHFTKQADDQKGKLCFETLRSQIDKKRKALISVHNMHTVQSEKIVAIDAAASEFDTPPDVFAPTFRTLREAGFKHFTYHAGEDFYHVLSGLRAIYEAVEFCDLQHGDRIGHASAAGIDISKWIEMVGKQIYMPHGEYADNLLFAYNLIKEQNLTELFSKLPILESKIEHAYYEVFSIKNTRISDIERAWKMRWYDPRKQNEIGEFKKCTELVCKLYENYHSSATRKEYKEPVEKRIEEDFSIDELKLLQKAMLCYLHEREIVIETIPTSNMRIGCHQNFATYQLLQWYQWWKEGIPLPPIVLGTDDPGIFSTNLYNEYSLIFCYLVYERKMERNDVMSFIETLYKNSEIYKFI